MIFVNIFNMYITFVIYFTYCLHFIINKIILYKFLRGYAKARPIHRRGEKFKFLIYCVYAWGVPLLMSIMLVVINSLDLSHMPWFVTPLIPEAGCFIEGNVFYLFFAWKFKKKIWIARVWNALLMPLCCQCGEIKINLYNIIILSN